MKCPSDAELLAFVDGQLSADDRASAESHLDGCASCLSIVAALARTSESPPGGRGEGTLELAGEGSLLADGEPRYVVGEELARGGMGRILAARDRLLDRNVALKLLRRGGEAIAWRFAREQRIAARLQHPAIIPVYDAGTLPGGEPFFAMRLVRGETLDKKTASAASLEERLRLLPAVLGVVDAIAYAHDEGVIHRDLKPQNVLVGPFGEVVVLDWGLARDLGAPDGAAPRAPSDPPVEGETATRAGELLGTLAYMAPEQTRGEEATAGSDVYGLGAILYHVLTGAPPHAGRSASMPSTATEEAAAPLGERAPEAPADLIAIVERAMASNAEARYPSARELAEDLRRWQAGRLVEAHRYTTLERLKRFADRNRAALFVAAAALSLLVAFGAVSLRRIFAEERRAIDAQGRAEVARDRAEKQRAAAETLVGFILGDLRGRLERVGRLDALGGVARAVASYQLASPPSEDAATSLRRAEAAGLAGDVALAIGDLDAAEESYRRSDEAARDASQKGDPASLPMRCQAALRIGDVQKRRGDATRAEVAYRTCVRVAEQVGGARGIELAIKSRLGLADVARGRNDLVEARRILEEGRGIGATLAGDPGAPASATHVLLALRSDLWKTLEQSGEGLGAREEARAALDLARALAAARPDDATARYDRAVAMVQLGTAEQGAGDLARAEALYREALGDHRALVVEDPTNVEWQRSVGVDLDRLAALMLAREDGKAALELLRESEAISERILAVAPSNAEWQKDLAISALSVGDVLSSLGHVEEARIETARALELQEHRPDRSDHDVALTLAHLGELDLHGRRADQGRDEMARAIDLLRKHLSSVDTPESRHELAAALLVLGESETGAAALARFEEAARVMERFRTDAAATPEMRELVQQADEHLKKAKSQR